MEFKLDTSVCEDGKIIQELFKKEDSIEERLHTWIINTKEESIKKALIKLGWKPPKNKNEQNFRE